jgi:hypothetical protein
VSGKIAVDPDAIDRYGRTIADHAEDVESVKQQLVTILTMDLGLGSDSFSDGFRTNYVGGVRALMDNVAGSVDGIRGIGAGLRAMAAAYRAADESSGH